MDTNHSESEICKNLISSIIKKYQGRGGLIEYRYTGSFAREIVGVLEKAEDTDSWSLSVDVACLVLEAAVGAYEYADDSGGSIGWVVEEALGQLEWAAEHNSEWEPELREEVFHKLLRLSESSVFDGWEEYRVALLRMCARFADVEAL